MNDSQKVIPYAIGPVYASVCADSSISTEEVAEEFNKLSPSGTDNGWTISKEKFATGERNPCPCSQSPATRTHYLFEC